MDKKTALEQGSAKGLTLFNMSYGDKSRQEQVANRIKATCQEEQEQWFPCTICEKAFRTENLLINHLTRVHKTTLRELDEVGRKRHCLYPNCQRKGDRGFFHFPSKEDQKSKWLRICGLSPENTVIHPHKKVTKKGLCGSCCVCSAHFSPSDINLSQQNILRLKTGAVPLDPPQPVGMQTSVEPTSIEQGTAKGLTLFNMPYGDMSRQGHVAKNNRHCLYPNCQRKGDRDFFAFPADEDRKSKWLRICGLSSETTHVIHPHVKGLCGSCSVCSIHFNPSDISLFQLKTGKWKKLLRTGAVPLDPPQPVGMRTSVEPISILPDDTEEWFPCNICDKAFQIKNLLTDHITREHKTDQPFKCRVCNISFVGKANLELHEQVHRGQSKTGRGQKLYHCNFCNRAFTDSSSLENHKKTHQQVHSCKMCYFKCESKDVFEAHFEKVHKTRKQKFHSCQYCNRVFEDLNTLINHEVMHSIKNVYKCNICKKKFSRLVFMNEHKRMDHGVYVPGFTGLELNPKLSTNQEVAQSEKFSEYCDKMLKESVEKAKKIDMEEEVDMDSAPSPNTDDLSSQKLFKASVTKSLNQSALKQKRLVKVNPMLQVISIKDSIKDPRLEQSDVKKFEEYCKELYADSNKKKAGVQLNKKTSEKGHLVNVNPINKVRTPWNSKDSFQEKLKGASRIDLTLDVGNVDPSSDPLQISDELKQEPFEPQVDIKKEATDQQAFVGDSAGKLYVMSLKKGKNGLKVVTAVKQNETAISSANAKKTIQNKLLEPQVVIKEEPLHPKAENASKTSQGELILSDSEAVVKQEPLDYDKFWAQRRTKIAEYQLAKRSASRKQSKPVETQVVIKEEVDEDDEEKEEPASKKVKPLE